MFLCDHIQEACAPFVSLEAIFLWSQIPTIQKAKQCNSCFIARLFFMYSFWPLCVHEMVMSERNTVVTFFFLFSELSNVLLRQAELLMFVQSLGSIFSL